MTMPGPPPSMPRMGNLTALKAVFLGALQGATEFLPVSSSGHLVIAQSLLGVQIEDGGLLTFDVFLHFGTLVAVVVFFWREIFEILTSPFRAREAAPGRSGMTVPQARRLGLMIVLATVPAAVVGLLLEDVFERLVSSAPAAAAMLLVTGGMLWATRRVRGQGEGLEGLTLRRSLIVGFAQALAIIPGISRSGSTISGGLFMGLNRDLAAKFAFLLAVPAIGGAAVLKLGDLSAFTGDLLAATAAGTLTAAVVGFACIKWLLGVVRRGHLSWFAPYCWAVGLATIAYVLISG